MFRSTFTLGKAFDKLAQLPSVAARIFRELIGSEVSPDLQARVQEIMATAPGLPSSPFEFATEKSARFYFWLVTSSAFSAASDGAHWIRSGDLENSWQVGVEYGAFTARVFIFSRDPSAKYVYRGQHQVPGHARTGWGSQEDEAAKTILREAKRATVYIWNYSVRLARKEVGL